MIFEGLRSKVVTSRREYDFVRIPIKRTRTYVKINLPFVVRYSRTEIFPNPQSRKADERKQFQAKEIARRRSIQYARGRCRYCNNYRAHSRHCKRSVSNRLTIKKKFRFRRTLATPFASFVLLIMEFEVDHKHG